MSALSEVQWLVQLHAFSQALLRSYSPKPKTLAPHFSTTLFDAQDKFIKIIFVANVLINMLQAIQLIVEQHGFELCQFTYTWVFVLWVFGLFVCFQ